MKELAEALRSRMTTKPNAVRRSKMVTITLSPAAAEIYEQLPKGRRAEWISRAMGIAAAYEQGKGPDKDYEISFGPSDGEAREAERLRCEKRDREKKR